MNIIPVIAKADTVNRSELDKLKIKIMSELVSNGVQIYQFPTEDEAVAEINSSMNVSPGSTQKRTPTTNFYPPEEPNHQTTAAFLTQNNTGVVTTNLTT